MNKLKSVIFLSLLIIVFLKYFVLSAEGANIYSQHPRIFLRSEKWDGGVDIKELRRRVQFGDWKRGWSRIKNGYAQSRGIPTGAIGYLVTNDEKRAKKVIELMLNTSQSAVDSSNLSNIWNKYEVLNDLSIGFDWSYNSSSFSREDKKILTDRMAALANRMIRYLRLDQHIFSRDMAQIASVGMIGLAIWGDHPDAEEFITFAKNELENTFDAFQYLEGSWPEGLGYLNEARLPYLLEFLEAYKSATEPSYSYFEKIAENQKNWLRKLLHFHIYNLRPDNTWIRSGDISPHKSYPWDNFVQNLEIITTEYQDTYGSDFLDRLEKGISPDPVYYKGYLFKYLLFHEPAIPVSPGVNSLPLEAIFAKNSLGYVVIRSGWGANDVFFRFNCGDYFTGHQHLDQGNFTIFKHAPLVIDSGYYANWGSKHRENYYTRTIAHNTVLIYQPDERFQSPYKSAGVNDGGQRVVWYYRRSAQQNSFTLTDYLSRKKSGAHYETGDIENFEKNSDYVYVDANITNAYNNPYFSAETNNPKITHFTRQIVAFKPEYYFIIFDRVSSVNPEYKKIWLLHSITEPRPVNAELLDAGLGYASYASDTIQIDNGKGRLFCKTVYPEKHKITILGGEEYEFWVDGYNQDEGVPLKLEKYAEPGAWRIEVEPTVSRKDDIFLHILYPCDTDIESMPETYKIKSDYAIGLQISDKVAMFNKDDTYQNELSYQVNGQINETDELQHLICNLKSDADYIVAIGNPDTKEVNQQEVLSTSSGTLTFKTLSTAQQNITIKLKEVNEYAESFQNSHK